MIDTTKELFAGLHKTEDEVRISLCAHVLGKTPQKNKGINLFIFQKDDRERVRVEQRGKHTDCRLTSFYLGTKDWNLHAFMNRSNVSAPFKFFSTFPDGEAACAVPDKLQKLIGKEFSSIPDFVAAMNDTFRAPTSKDAMIFTVSVYRGYSEASGRPFISADHKNLKIAQAVARCYSLTAGRTIIITDSDGNKHKWNV